MTGLDTDDELIVNVIAAGYSADNYEEIDQNIDAGKLGDKLVQSNSQKGTLREFQFYDQTHLLVSRGNFKGDGTQQYRVNLAWVNSEPLHNKIVDWNWLVIALIFGVIAITFLVLAITEVLTIDYSMIGGSITFTLTLLATLIFIYKLRDEYTFYSQFGKAELFVMENKRPSQRVFDGFFLMLQSAIENAAQHVSIEDRLVGELKMCRRLKDEHVIDEQAYTDARTAIFHHERYKT